MATNTTPLNSLKLEWDGTDVSCQLINPEFAPAGIQPNTEIVLVACPDGQVPAGGGTPTPGSLTAEAFADTLDTGVTKLMADAYAAGAEIDYTYTYRADQDPTIAMQWSGTLVVNSFTLPGQKPGNARHPVDLVILTSVFARPAP